MTVIAQVVNLIDARPVTVLDRWNGRAYTTTDIIERRAYRATVDGIPWTVEQTEQADRDAGLCRCRACACCRIRAAVNRAEQ